MLRAGIIGLGVGEQHINGYADSPYAEPVAICDFNYTKLQEVAKRTGIKYAVTDAESILKNPDIDIVSIATFDQFHARQVIQALEENKHVFVEKPLCLTKHELNSISETFEKKNNSGKKLQLSSNFILREEKRFIELKQRILKGQLGEIFSVEGSYDYGRSLKLINGWRAETNNYSVMHGGGVHIIDLLQWLTGYKFSVTNALANKTVTRETNFKPLDNIISIGRFGNNILGKISANFGSQTPHFHQIKIYGTKGTFVHDCGRASYFFGSEPNVIVRNIRTKFPSAKKGDILPKFIESIYFQRTPEINFESVRKVMSTSIEITDLVKTE